MKRTSLLMLVLAVAALVSSCAEPPTADIEAAKSSVEAARSAEAPKYATAEFNALEDSIKAITAELEVQKNKFALFRSYDGVKQTAMSTKSNAEQVATLARENKAKAKAEAEAALNDANTSVTAAKDALDTAPVGKDNKADIAQMKSDLAGIEAQIPGVQAAIGSEDFFGAKDKAVAIKSSADNVKSQVDAAIAKYQEKHPNWKPKVKN
jgi:HAMP domain-containing protein